MQSISQTMAVPTAADAWTNFTAFTAPAGATRIVQVSFATSPDEADPAGVRFAPVLHISGSGVAEQDPHFYLGNAGNIASKTTSGAYASELNVANYDVDIPIAVGGSIQAQGLSIGEAYTAGTFDVAVGFDNGQVAQKNSMSDYVSHAQPTAADSWQLVGTLTVPALASGNNPTAIKELCMMHATDQATLALLRAATRFRISGAGVNEFGTHEFLGPHSGTGCNTAGVLGYSHQMVRQKCQVPVNAGGAILVEAYVATELPTAGTVALGVLYQ
jgi:hypothetical protein